MTDDSAYREVLINLLSEILKWTKFIGKQQLKLLLLDNLKEDVEKIIYELSDGKSLREIESICRKHGFSISFRTVGRYWEKWTPVGIVEPSRKYKGRYEKIVSLKEIGIDYPQI
jgi:hypothetical protein